MLRRSFDVPRAAHGSMDVTGGRGPPNESAEPADHKPDQRKSRGSWMLRRCSDVPRAAHGSMDFYGGRGSPEESAGPADHKPDQRISQGDLNASTVL